MKRQLWHVLLCIGAGLCVGQPCAEGLMLMNEILADPSAISGDANGDGVIHNTQDEFIELVNTVDEPVSLAQWSLSDLVQVRHVFAPATFIPSLGFFVVFGGGSPQGFVHAEAASSHSLGLNNTGDTLTLRDANGTIIDIVSYGPEGGLDVSLTRAPDAWGAFVQHHTAHPRSFSPGTTIDGAATLSVPTSRSPIPEPASLVLLGTGLLGVMPFRRRTGPGG